MSDYQIIELLCSADKANLEKAEQICTEQKWKLKTILEKYGYADLGLKKPKDFLRKELKIRNKKISKLPALLPAGLKTISLLGTEITELPDSLPAGLEHLFLQQNQIRKYPNQFPASLKAINCSHDELSSLPFGLFEGLQTLNCAHNSLTVLPALPSSLQMLFCSHNQLTELPALPPTLGNLQIAGNLLTELPAALPDTLYFLDCSDNPNLKFDNLKQLSQKSFTLIALNCPHFSPDMLPEGFVQQQDYWVRNS